MGVCSGKTGGNLPSCNNAAIPVVRLDARRSNDTCGTVDGRVQICEENVWKNLCDINWTMQDAQVTCRSLGYSAMSEFTELLLATI